MTVSRLTASCRAMLMLRVNRIAWTERRRVPERERSRTPFHFMQATWAGYKCSCRWLLLHYASLLLISCCHTTQTLQYKNKSTQASRHMTDLIPLEISAATAG